ILEHSKSAEGRRRLPPSKRSDLVNWAMLRDEPFCFRPVHGGTTPDVMELLFPDRLRAEAGWAFGTISEDYLDLLPALDLSLRIDLSYATSSFPEHFNLRTDRGGMLASIESRLPLQDPALVELMIATPDSWRFRGGSTSKYIFRRLVERHVGAPIAARGKYGF